MHSRHRQLVCIQLPKGVPAVAVDDKLQVNPADTLEADDHKRVYGHQGAGMSRKVMEFRAEAHEAVLVLRKAQGSAPAQSVRAIKAVRCG